MKERKKTFCIPTRQ